MSEGHRFSKCPTWWVRSGVLRDGFGAMDAGTSIAGLKCIIAISHDVNFHSLESSLSYSDLEERTGLSRPMVRKGLQLIEDLELIEVDRGYRNKYTLIEDKNDPGWAKLPIYPLKYELKRIPNKGRITLYGLRFYIQLLSDRPNTTNQIHMKYETIQSKVGTQGKDIKGSIDLLFNHQLISVSRVENHETERKEYKVNRYEIRGV